MAYSAEVMNALERSLSTDRLNRYVIQAKGDKEKAIRFHEHNTEVAEGLFGVIQGLEITFRNSVHRTLKKEIGFDNWYDHIGLENPEAEALFIAKEAVSIRHKPPTPPRVIAKLGFGFWVRLTSGDYEKAIWVPFLYKVFPLRANRRAVNLRLNSIKELRNKIAHHERIIDRDLKTEYLAILETLA